MALSFFVANSIVANSIVANFIFVPLLFLLETVSLAEMKKKFTQLSRDIKPFLKKQNKKTQQALNRQRLCSAAVLIFFIYMRDNLYIESSNLIHQINFA